MTEERDTITVINIPSQADPDCRMVCPDCNVPTVQRQVDYLLTVNNQRFSFPQVWTAVCSKFPEDQEHMYHDPDVGEAIDEGIWEAQHPLRESLADSLPA